jgi:hypothetical protein
MVERDNAKVFTHPSYSGSTLDNDFALLVKLDSPVSSSVISPVNMDQGQFSPFYDASE